MVLDIAFTHVICLDDYILILYLISILILDCSTGRVIRRFHLGSRHAADTLGLVAAKVAVTLKASVPIPEAMITLKGFKFRIVRPLVKGLEVKTPYGLGTIVKLKGIEGVVGFSLVVQLDSWVLAGGQKPMLYCEADEVLAVTESYGTLSSNGSRALHKSAQRSTMSEAMFAGDDNLPEEDDKQVQDNEGLDEEGRSRRPKRACRSIMSDKMGNLIVKEFHVAIHYYLQENDESPICRWQNDGREFLIYKEDVLASNVRSLMGIHATTREKKRLRQWLLREMFDHGFIRTR